MSTLAKGPDCSGMSFQDWLYVALGPDLGELAVFLFLLAGLAAIVGLVVLIMRLYKAV